MKLRGKVGLILILVSLILSLLILVLFFPIVRNNRIELIKTELSQQLEHLDFSISSFILEKQNDVLALSRNELLLSPDDGTFTNFLEADPETFEYQIGPLEEDMISILNSYWTTHSFVNSVYVGRENGAFIRSHPRSSPTQYDPRQRPWYIAALDNPAVVVRTDPYQSVTSSDINLGMVKALHDQQGDIIGVLGMDITLANLAKFLNTFEIGHNGRIMLVDEKGIMMVGGDQKLLLNNIAYHYSDWGQQVMNTDSGSFTTQDDFAVYHTSSDLGWKLIIFIPSSTIFIEALNAFVYPFFGVFISVLFLSILTSISLNRLVLKPIGELADTTRQITETGDLSIHVGIPGKDEISSMAASFQAMIDSIKEREAEMGEYVSQLEALREVGLRISSSLETDSILDIVFQYALDLVGGDKAHIFLYQGGDLILKSAYSNGERTDYSVSQPRKEGLTYQVAQTGKMMVVPDVTKSSLYQNFDPNWKGAIIGVPISSSERVFGVVNIGFDQPHDFNESEIRILTLLADQAGVALDNAQLHDVVRNYASQLEEDVRLATLDIQKKAEELESLFEIGKEITASLDLQDTLQKIVNQAIQLVGADKGLIILAEKEKEKLTRIVGSGYSIDQFDTHSYQEMMDGISGWVLIHKEPALSANIKVDHRNRNLALKHALEGQDQAIAVAPLLIAEKAFGTLTVVNQEGKAEFTEHDLQLVSMLAGQAAIAIQNAELYEEAQEADRLKSAFLASMSHELRTPLNSIIGFTGIIVDGLAGPLNEEQAYQLKMVQESAQHLLSLINDVLDISKIEANQLEVYREPLEFRPIIEKVIQTLKPLAGEKGLYLEVELEGDVNTIIIDRRRFEQILINLINNAIKFTERGGVTVCGSRQNSYMLFEIRDTGIGIKEEDLKKIFQAFRQIDSGVARKYEGTGLGLSISKKLVELLQGEIGVRTEYGLGSTFWFTIPLEKE